MQALLNLATALDAGLLMERLGMDPDPWQLRVLRSDAHRLLLLCGRQCGKSSVSAMLGLHTALYRPGSLTLLLSPSLRQSSELYKKLAGYYHDLGRPVPLAQETQLTLTLENRSRVVSLPGQEATVRGFSGVDLLIVDEAARVPDELYLSVRPMLATSAGRLVALSTPYGKRGWFFREWTTEGSDWEKVSGRADQCSRIPMKFLEEERRALGLRWYRQEYLCCFEDVIDAVFSQTDIDAALCDDVPPLFTE